jgi:ATP-dependent DNA helicase RecQ
MNNIYNKKFTANYIQSNHNFIIQNLPKIDKQNKHLPIIYVLKNILQRGTPTRPSKFLKANLDLDSGSNDLFPLISNKASYWYRIIKGDIENNNIPAKIFLEEIIPSKLGDYKFIQQLIVPEVQINDITQVSNKYFGGQQVDFYLPQASLVIEIDGEHHNSKKEQDKERDKFLAEFAIKTIRINTIDIYNDTDQLKVHIDEIIKRLEFVIYQQDGQKKESLQASPLIKYKEAYIKNQDINTNDKYRAVAIIRFQLLLLELLENNILNFNDEWNLEILSHDIKDFCNLAIADLCIWFSNLFTLNSLKFNIPKYNISYVSKFSELENTLKIDFSILKRYTDVCQINDNIIFVRTDYFDVYRVLDTDNPNNLKKSYFKQHDYFMLSTAKLIKYKLKIFKQEVYNKSLLFFVKNIFLYAINNVTFNLGQLQIIKNSLKGYDTIGLLPTGSGKSLCYQLATILQPTVNFVVCPIKSLMYDQKDELDNVQITRTNHITSDVTGHERNFILDNYSRGKYFCIFISPERFQTSTFRDYLTTMNENLDFGYAIIDEVHCLSEWGHDFRTSYLNLASTIKKYMPNAKYIGLTATASIGVLKDIQSEFSILDSNVKHLASPTREELEFEVIVDKNNDKYGNLRNILYKEKYLFNEKENDYKSGLIFTQTVNGKNNKGCYNLSNLIKKDLGLDARFFSGSIPKVNGVPIMKFEEFDKYRIEVQKYFKENKFPLMVATKAFGMGVNKKNIFFTIHYGIPSSMEALYQEAGRAGRDKEKFSKTSKAKCIVLFTSEDKDNLNVFTENINLSDTKEASKKLKGDLSTNFFMFNSSLESIENELLLLIDIYNNNCSSEKKNIVINGSSIRIGKYPEEDKSKLAGVGKQKIEKGLYRLKQLGIIEDWTIENFFGSGRFIISCCKYDEKSISDSLISIINKYDSEFTSKSLYENSKYIHYKEIANNKNFLKQEFKYFEILLLWSYDYFAGHRKKSLKNIYENCKACSSENGISNEKFKQRLENYFKITTSTSIFQKLADEPDDYMLIKDIFFQDKKLINEKKQNILRDQLSRFLETYLDNTSLNIVSGLIRLLLNDYFCEDGKNRLDSAMLQIKDKDSNTKNELLDLLLSIGNNLPVAQKNELSKTLFIAYSKDNEYIFHNLYDEYSLSYCIGLRQSSISNINKKIRGLKWIS